MSIVGIPNGSKGHIGGAGPTRHTVENLQKRYGEVEAVRGVDFDVQVGETFGFLGPNGAGKPTGSAERSSSLA